MVTNSLEQLYSLGIFTITGIIISLFFDLFRVLRKTSKTSDFITYIEDIVFWLITAVILLFTIFKFNNGELRLYIFVGLFFGIIIYILTLSKYFIKVNIKIVTGIKFIIFKLIINPINFIIKVLQNIGKKFTNIYKKSLIKKKNNVKINSIKR